MKFGVVYIVQSVYNKLIWAPSNKYRLPRAIFGLIFGVCLSFLLWKYVIRRLGLPLYLSHWCLFVTTLFLGKLSYI